MHRDLDPSAVVVRGGLCEDLDRLREQAEDACEDAGFYGLSIYCTLKDAEEDVEETIARVVANSPINNRQIRVASAQALYDRALGIRKTGPDPYHYDVDLGTAPTHAVLQRFVDALEPPRRSPRWS